MTNREAVLAAVTEMHGVDAERAVHAHSVSRAVAVMDVVNLSRERLGWETFDLGEWRDEAKVLDEFSDDDLAKLGLRRDRGVERDDRSCDAIFGEPGAAR